MPHWARYPKIPHKMPNSDASSSANDEWIVTEKLHGANFSVLVDACARVHFASRGGILAEHDNFFGFRTSGLHEQLAKSAQDLRDAILAPDNWAPQANTNAGVIIP